MKDFRYLIILVTWAGILLAPLVAITFFVLVRKKWPQYMKMTIESCVAFLLVILCLSVHGISFRILIANIMCVIMAYGAFCFLMASCWCIRLKFLKFTTTIVMLIPILLVYALTTVGALGFMFIMADYVQLPAEKIMEPGLVCRKTVWGGAWGDSGYNVQLFKHWSVLPFIEGEVAKIVVNQSHPQGGPEDATCDDAMQQYTRKIKGDGSIERTL